MSLLKADMEHSIALSFSLVFAETLFLQTPHYYEKELYPHESFIAGKIAMDSWLNWPLNNKGSKIGRCLMYKRELYCS